eukprot:TRINITY_DN10461_c0_g1_i1.p1 TRINITY_DN10461_c0_g1~~TRINITY_DN10461_c0_g1_i1.p1  ORF type:complete len:312 (-),score=35.77 TRINITY_DN10461_c0_g1_i1:65-1000(-)
MMRLCIVTIFLLTVIYTFAGPVYDRSVAFRSLSFCGIVNGCNWTEIADWDCPGCKNISGAHLLAELSDNPEQNFAIVVADPQAPTGPQIVVAIRGTTTWRNWVEDVEAWHDKVDFLNITDVSVHAGFYNGWMNLRVGIHAAVAKGFSQYPNARLQVVGHSLGGSLGEIFAVDFAISKVIGTSSVQELQHIAHSSRVMPIYRDVYLYNFGAPRVGNQGWAVLAQSSIYSYYRHTHRHDIVPQVPPRSMDYQHTPTEVWLSDKPALDITLCSTSNGEDPNCIDSTVVPSFNDHVTYLGYDITCGLTPFPAKSL